MKKLSDVTKEDAKAILSASAMYSTQLRNKGWVLTDESEVIKEPCKKFICTDSRGVSKYIFWFWFMSDSIDITFENVEMVIDNLSDVKLECYIKAVELGYYVPKLSELLNKDK